MNSLGIFFISFISTLFVTPLVRKYSLNQKLLDEPNHRKIHNKPMVRLGGIAMLIGFIIPIISLLIINKPIEYYLNEIDYKLLIIIIFFSLIGLCDDLFNISPLSRLITEIILSTIIWINGFQINTLSVSFLDNNIYFLNLNSNISLLITIIWIVGILNAINWIDGIDGLASSISLIAFLPLILIYNANQQFLDTYLVLALTGFGTCLGFIPHNKFPSKIHMGDCGSYFLGASLAISTLITSKITNNEGVEMFLIDILLLVLFIPIIDMVIVILNRIRRLKSPFYPDKTHLHHRLLSMGYSPKTITSLLYSITLLLVSISLFILNNTYAKYCMILCIVSIIYINKTNIKNLFKNN